MPASGPSRSVVPFPSSVMSHTPFLLPRRLCHHCGPVLDRSVVDLPVWLALHRGAQDHARRLVAGQPSLHGGDEVVVRDGRVTVDDRANGLAEAVVRYAHNGRVRHARMGLEDLLDLFGEDL